MKYIIKITFTAKANNPNFAGQTLVWYGGKGNASDIGKETDTPECLKNWAMWNGWNKKHHATKKANIEKSLKEPYWEKVVEILEF